MKSSGEVLNNIFKVKFDIDRPEYHKKNKSYVYVEEKSMINIKDFSNLTLTKCSKCGCNIYKENSKCSEDENYYCDKCLEMQRYSSKNSKRVNVDSKYSITYGFELECVPYSQEYYMNMLKDEYMLIPTQDGSLPKGGVEFKTPTYGNLDRLKEQFEQFEKWVDFSNEKCGQHINIGCRAYINKKSMKYVKEYGDIILFRLAKYSMSHEKSIEKIFGRKFNGYAIPYISPKEHRSWISFRNNNRIEFRLSKFINSNQYFTLVEMCEEMTICIIDNFIKKIKFSKVHVFPYSDRIGTIASKLDGKVDIIDKKIRVLKLINFIK